MQNANFQGPLFRGRTRIHTLINSLPFSPPYFIYHDYKIHGSILSIIRISVIHGSSISIKTVKSSFQYSAMNGFQYLVLLKKLFLYEVQEGFQLFLTYHKDSINLLFNFLTQLPMPCFVCLDHLFVQEDCHFPSFSRQFKVKR